jgi:hypothetical protein
VADGVWVRQSEWVWTNSIAVRGEDGLILIDPGVDESAAQPFHDFIIRGQTVPTGSSERRELWKNLLADQLHLLLQVR